jgi:beta-lactam-binding protein with PASTA domain
MTTGGRRSAANDTLLHTPVMYCGWCGVRIIGEGSYCDRCGSPLGRSTVDVGDAAAEDRLIRRRCTLAMGCVATAALLVTLAFALGPSRDFAGDHMPDVTEITAAAAESTLREAGLTCEFAPPELSAAVREGLVLWQRPPPASRLPEDGEVTLALSLGPGLSVPDVFGMPQDHAMLAIEGSGLVGEVAGSAVSIGIPRGFILDVEPPPGARLPRGAVVGVVVSSGEPPPVPTVIGLSGAEAKQVVRAVGLEYAIGGKAFSTSVARGYVLRQEPLGGGDRPADGRVRVVLSLGRGVLVPDVSGLGEAGGRRSLERADLTAKVSRRRSAAPAGRVIGSEPEAGRRLPRRGVVTLVVSVGPEPAVEGCGFLRVETEPSELDVWVYVDGEGPRGQTPATLRVSPGHHRLILYAPDRGGRDNIHVAVRPGETLAIRRSFR